MRAVQLQQKEYRVTECPLPAMGKGEVLVKVAYAGINRADLLQKQGRYPQPEGRCAIPGMEVSGTIEACAADVKGWNKGDGVCCVLYEGGFAEYVSVPACVLLPVNGTLSLEKAAALPEGCLTAWLNLVEMAHIRKGESVLVHGGASGVGSIIVAMARMLGATVYATAGSQPKCELCLRAGAARAIAYKREDFVEVIAQETGGNGVDVIIDMVGGSYVERNFAALARGGRVCILSFLDGAKVTINLAPILLKQLCIMGATLRSQTVAQKEAMVVQIRESIWETVLQEAINPMIDRIFSLEEAEKAMERMDQGLNVGKILLRI